jgi:hypothetical protein
VPIQRLRWPHEEEEAVAVAVRLVGQRWEEKGGRRPRAGDRERDCRAVLLGQGSLRGR